MIEMSKQPRPVRPKVVKAWGKCCCLEETAAALVYRRFRSALPSCPDASTAFFCLLSRSVLGKVPRNECSRWVNSHGQMARERMVTRAPLSERLRTQIRNQPYGHSLESVSSRGLSRCPSGFSPRLGTCRENWESISRVGKDNSKWKKILQSDGDILVPTVVKGVRE